MLKQPKILSPYRGRPRKSRISLTQKSLLPRKHPSQILQNTNSLKNLLDNHFISPTEYKALVKYYLLVKKSQKILHVPSGFREKTLLPSVHVGWIQNELAAVDNVEHLHDDRMIQLWKKVTTALIRAGKHIKNCLDELIFNAVPYCIAATPKYKMCLRKALSILLLFLET